MRGVDQIGQYDSFANIGSLAPRPLLMIAGSEAATAHVSRVAVEQAGKSKELFWLDGASHFDLYGQDEYVSPALAKLTSFSGEHPTQPPVEGRAASIPPHTRKEHHPMSERKKFAPPAIQEFAPKLAEVTDTVLFGDIWERPGLSPRDRSLVTVTALAALYRNDQLGFHLGKALENGVTKDELVEAITHLAFYAGWPNAMTAMTQLKEIVEKSDQTG